METKTVENLHAVQLLASLAMKLNRSKLKSTELKELDDDLNKIADYMRITNNQALVFSVVFNLQMNDTRNLDIRDVANYLDVNFIDLMIFKTDIDVLIARRYIRTEGIATKSSVPFKNLIFSIDKDILSSIFMNSSIAEPKPEKEMDVFAFVKKVSGLIEHRSEKTICTTDLYDEVKTLEYKNKSLTLLQKMELVNLDIEDRVIYYEVCDDFINGGKTGVDCTLNDIYDNLRDRFNKMKEFKEQTSRLFEIGFVKLTEAGFMSDAVIELTQTGLEVFMGADAKLFQKKNDKSLIHVDKIAGKALFFDAELEKQVRFVEQSLQNDKFVTMQNRLEQMAMPKGVAAIFYGAPGTGKTETVYQLAKVTGRAIMHVDISQSKSMWFGESEKKIKEIFTNYAQLCKSCEIKPILLFNEADAIFGKRKESNASNVAQTENAMQNIILEEMEKLDGILIATTNLNQNLDAAFERRFLFKIKFEKPSDEAKRKIWQSKLTWLKEEDASFLAADYSFSGGEIDNIVRKVIMEEVLNDTKPELQQIITYCDSEKFSSKAEMKKLGF